MLLKVSQAAEYLQVSRRQAYKLIRDGAIPTVKLSPHGIRVS